MLKNMVVAFATVFALALLPATFAADQATSTAPGVQQKGERHPEMHRALHALERAKEDLEHAAHDFGGHRAKALELTNQAIQEVKAGLAYDKK